MEIDWIEILTNIGQNWDKLIYLASLMIAIIFRGKKQLTEDEKLKLEEEKQHKKNLKTADKLEKGLEKEKKLKEKQNSDTSN